MMSARLHRGDHARAAPPVSALLMPVALLAIALRLRSNSSQVIVGGVMILDPERPIRPSDGARHDERACDRPLR